MPTQQRRDPRAPTTGARRDVFAPPAARQRRPARRTEGPATTADPCAAFLRPCPDPRQARPGHPWSGSRTPTSRATRDRPGPRSPLHSVRSPARAACAAPRRNPARCGGRRWEASRPTTRRPGRRSRRPSWVGRATSPAPPADGRPPSAAQSVVPGMVALIDHAQWAEHLKAHAASIRTVRVSDVLGKPTRIEHETSMSRPDRKIVGTECGTHQARSEPAA